MRHTFHRSLRPLTLCVLLPALAVLAAGSAGAAPAARAPQSAPLSPERLERISRSYLGKPYKLDCLGEASGADRDPLFTRKWVDCQTLVEQVMAEAVQPLVGDMDRAVRLVRYRDSNVRLENRYHYCIPDWLESRWPARDVTAEVGGARVRTVKRRIDLPGFLAQRGGDGSLSPNPARTVVAPYIPRDQISTLQPDRVDGTIGVLVLDKPAIVAGHVGFLFRKNGEVIFRHASQKRNRVIDEPLRVYMARAPRSFIGMMVLRPDAAGLRR
ncbi:MAG TPA: N-acetylmuramoyl-L-alanine amidase-like domain-containing protein [Armatimonadota bacterium]|nr:N-acetylmuramoyl-L-alanine amidase-like domain-containing protein [Armatimonadota bacterium]